MANILYVHKYTTLNIFYNTIGYNKGITDSFQSHQKKIKIPHTKRIFKARFLIGRLSAGPLKVIEIKLERDRLELTREY